MIKASIILAKNLAPAKIHLYVGGARIPAHNDYWEELQALIKSANDLISVTFCDFVTDVPSFFASLDVYVLASRSEGCPNTILEAMAAGLPVITTDVGCARDLIGANSDAPAAIMVPKDAPEAMAEGLLNIANDRRLASLLAERGKERVKARYTLDHYAHEHAEIFDKLLRHK